MSLAKLIADADAALERGEVEAAERLYRAALAAGSANPALPYNLGTLAAGRGDWAAAVGLFRQARTLDPAFLLAWYNLGCAARQLGQWPEAEQALREALALQPDYHPARVNLSLVRFAQGDIPGAIALAYQALEAEPDDPDVFANLSSFLRAGGALEEARLCAEAALRLQPEHADAWVNLASLAHDARAHADAAWCCEQALRVAPQHAAAHWNLALAALALGDFARGWAEYAWRRQLPAMRPHYPPLASPGWQGEPLAGRRVLLRAEQGHGDTLQFIRLAQALHARGARIVAQVQPALVRLLGHCPWLETVLPLEAAAPDCDFAEYLLDLPQRLQLRLADLPGPLPYLFPDPAEQAGWRQRLAGETRPKIGLVWAGDNRPHDPESQRIDRRRSLALAQLAPLLALPDFAWYSLQKGGPAAEAGAYPALQDFSAEWGDFAATAAFVAELDLVISVDTAVAHLAAGLGRPTWLLSRFDACWRWLDNRPDSPWYPGLRLFGQPRPGDWAPVIVELQTALATELGTLRA